MLKESTLPCAVSEQHGGIALGAIVLLFPVVQPWYLLWVILPLAAGNRTDFPHPCRRLHLDRQRHVDVQRVPNTFRS